MDINRATAVDEEVEKVVRDQFEYHPWTEDQIAGGKVIREALIDASLSIIRYAPPCPDRSVALRKLREARMDANSAITHRGRF